MKRETHLQQNPSKSGTSRMKILGMILTLVLVAGTVAGGTFAWLTVETDPIVNTFTYGDVDLKLDETKVDRNGDTVDENQDEIPDKTTEGNEYEMIPGKDYLKDPAVTVLAGSKACWLFVKLEEKGGITIINGDGTTTTYDFDDYLIYEIEKDWIPLQQMDDEGNFVVDEETGSPVYVEGVYFRQVKEDVENTEDTGISYGILKDNKISVPETVSKEMLNVLDDNGQNTDTASEVYPSLSVTAYAVQYSGFEPEVDEGADGPTEEQLNAAALKAWQTVETENPATP